MRGGRLLCRVMNPLFIILVPVCQGSRWVAKVEIIQLLTRRLIRLSTKPPTIYTPYLLLIGSISVLHFIHSFDPNVVFNVNK